LKMERETCRKQTNKTEEKNGYLSRIQFMVRKEGRRGRKDETLRSAIQK